MEVARAADIGVVDHCRALCLARRAIEVVGEDGSNALVVERADRDGAGSNPSARAGLSPRKRRKMPRQVRKPCSGCGRWASTARISPSVSGPIERAQRRKRSGVHSA